MRHTSLACLALLLSTLPAAAGGPDRGEIVVGPPTTLPTLVNPNCSHCRDEAKRRADAMRADDRVLCWLRGYSDGGAIPYRFFLNPYRVISDTYGVFVHDADAGYARGFAPSLDFRFHGWRNGVMVMRHKDGTLYSCLSGVAFDGPGKGKRLKPVPTLVSTWGDWLKRYPHAVTYQLFDKYQPVDLPAGGSERSRKSRGAADPRLGAEEAVLGVVEGGTARAYRLTDLAKAGLLREEVAGKPRVLLWHGPTRTAAAYTSQARPPKGKAEPRSVTLKLDRTDSTNPFVDQQTGSRWDIAGRAVAGPLKGWTLDWLDGTQVKWFAWAAEYPKTTLYEPTAGGAGKAKVEKAVKEIAGTAEFLRGVPKKYATLRAADPAKHTVTLRCDGDKADTTWPVTPDAEIKVRGWWGRLDELPSGGRVWCWFQVNRKKAPVAIFMIADEVSEQDIHNHGVVVKAISKDRLTVAAARGTPGSHDLGTWTYLVKGAPAPKESLKPKARVYVRREPAGAAVALTVLDGATFEAERTAQKRSLAKRWADEGLPGTVAFAHLSGELDCLLDHEAMRWARSLKPGDKVQLAATPPIKAVVKTVAPWRERTQLRLVVNGFDLAELRPGRRIHLRMPAPSQTVQDDVLPPDLGRARTRQERIDWFLASIYCTCGVRGDGCTGHFYTLASCNPNACAMPNYMREHVAELIDRGQSDRHIFETLLQEQGPDLLRPHLLP